MPVNLSVNLNAIAMLRNRRDLPWPSLTHLGRIALEAGASGLTVHPRPDQRHVRFSDVSEIRALLTSDFLDREFNIEGYPDEAFLRLVEKHRPEQVTLVPDDPRQSTSDHGWDFISRHRFIGDVVGRLKRDGFRVSLFADPDASRQALQIARDVGADRIELFTGPYGSCFDNPREAAVWLARLSETANIAHDVGLMVNAGHDLTIANLPALVAAIPHLAEVSIGHALIADCLEFGMAETVRRFRQACG